MTGTASSASSARRRLRPASITALIVVVLAGAVWWAWQSALGPAARVRSQLLALGQPVPGAPDGDVTVTWPDCEGNCVVARRNWTPATPLTFAEVRDRVAAWATAASLDPGTWQCGRNAGPFGEPSEMGGCELPLTGIDPVFVSVAFTDPAAVGRAFAGSTTVENGFGPPPEALQTASIGRVTLQVSTR